MNILTFDIEEWYLELLQGGRREKFQEFDRYLTVILEQLERRKIRATFFCLGAMAVSFPEVIKRIAERGHEIGCHSNRHVWLNKMSYEEVLEDTRRAVDALQQCLGQSINSYRAPAFSIGEKNKWAFEILTNCGIEHDASVFPATRDFGGFPEFTSQEPSIITCNGITLKEYPICLTSVCGKQIAYSGGGYFRFFPLDFIKNRIKNSDYVMTYFHIRDLLPETKRVMTKVEYEKYFKENGSLLNRYKRYIKGKVGTKGAYKKLYKLIDFADFVSIGQADKIIDWSRTPHIEL